MRKVIAKIMDVSFVKKFHKQYVVTKVKRCLVYDPRLYIPKVIVNQIEKEK
jgi:hypothetical protein